MQNQNVTCSSEWMWSFISEPKEKWIVIEKKKFRKILWVQ
jgi:hypothetical protein